MLCYSNENISVFYIILRSVILWEANEFMEQQYSLWYPLTHTEWMAVFTH